MNPTGIIAVVGQCSVERSRYARQLAAHTKRFCLPATWIERSRTPIEQAILLATETSSGPEVVVEMPRDVIVKELIGELANGHENASLISLVCVIDVACVLADLDGGEHLPLGSPADGDVFEVVARAQLMVEQIEYASTVVLVNWERCATAPLATLMALVNHLSPRAALTLFGTGNERVETNHDYAARQDRAGWVSVLNGDFAPYMADSRVSALRYEQVRPLHPQRLQRLLDDRIEPGEFGRVVRSAGFCRLATRTQIVAQREHVGKVISLNPIATDAIGADDDELLACGQELAFIGLDLDHDALIAALDEAALTDEEFAAGPVNWATFVDPFPEWMRVSDH
ncbi:GTP-binding protein [Salinibacterium sp. SWN139]|uniref:GTP-binding protein n=1 Tax=Salinibacterium sp. SWN139 TaxID=2792055 RepID=UPI0018CE7BEA|nr:GTP-binding protein [Salinibacterium sp. SWN139]MBH0054414.1 GTP-binding protein [Salinibacterium sp. SWN139]